MSTFNFRTSSPNTVSMMLVGQTALFSSPLIASAQTLDRGGMKWQYTLNFTNISGAKRGIILGKIARLRAQANRARIPVYDNPSRGEYGGTPLVDLGSQTGSQINIKGCTTGVTGWIRAGDYFSIDVNGEHELKMCTINADSDGGGLATIDFEPRLRASPLNNAVVSVNDGVITPVPEGVWVLADSTAGWSSRPFQSASELSQVVLTFVEDVFATQ